MPDQNIHFPIVLDGAIDRGRDVARLVAALPRPVRQKLLAFLYMAGQDPGGIEANLAVSDAGAVSLTVLWQEP